MENHSSFLAPNLLKGKRALIFGVANERSLAWAISTELHNAGVDLGFTFASETLERRVRPLASSVGSNLVLPCDVTREDEIDSVFRQVKEKWGGLDILIHAVAFANREDLEGRFIDTKKDGFLKALEVSAYSLVALARRAEPLMEGRQASMVTLTYYGSQKVVPNYNVMGVAKAALEASVRYLANDLGPKKIRVNAISAGPVKTLAAAGIRDFRKMLAEAAEKTPLRENITAEEVGALGAYLCTPAARHTTGSTYFIDSGAHILA